ESELGFGEARCNFGELEQVPVLVEILVREVDAIHPEHGIEVLRRNRIGGEKRGVALLELENEMERQRELPFRCAGIALLDRNHELPDGASAAQPGIQL